VLIDNILDMAKFDTGLFELAPHKFSFSDMAEQLVADIAAKTEEKKQKFTFDIDPAIPVSLITDERRLRQALFNLLINAVTFTPSGGSVHFSAKRLDDEDGECVLRFEVKDTGIGITDEHKARLWNSFEQEDSSITRAHGGTGIGLSITKSIVEMMHGTIDVESETGRGSRFICTVRARPDREDSGTETGGKKTVSLAGKRILVVDDVEINRDIIFAVLEDTGAVLDGAGNGEEAVELFRKNNYDLILMDLHMPGMDGFETSRRIRAVEKPGAHTPVIIAISADTGGVVVSRCLEAGMNSHIGKPVDSETLIKLLVRGITVRV
jgi:CheY-like chemotaxis protein